VFFLSPEKMQRLPPDQTVTDHILRWGYDHPGITSTNPQLKQENYTLTIDGEVEAPVTLNWNDFLALPQSVSVSDFHCVEGWSVRDCKWEGVRIYDIEKLVKPKAWLGPCRLSAPTIIRLHFFERSFQATMCCWLTN
jgi:DMSO/TMAO reductase YedYZ molybdopterin-dependent catalytic subunit